MLKYGSEPIKVIPEFDVDLVMKKPKISEFIDTKFSDQKPKQIEVTPKKECDTQQPF